MWFNKKKVDVKKDICILIFGNDQILKFLHKETFTKASNIRNNIEILNKLIGSRIIFGNGKIKTIKNIQKKDLVGSNIISRIYNYLIGLYYIEVTYENIIELDIDDIKKILIDNIQNNKLYNNENSFDHFFVHINDINDAIPIILKNLKSIKTYEDIFFAFGYDKKEVLKSLDNL